MSKYVTDELIERGAVEARAWGVRSSHGGWSDEETQRNCARDILEATAPLIAAQVLRDAADNIEQRCGERRGGPRSKITCEKPRGHMEVDWDHAARGVAGQWYFWRDPEKQIACSRADKIEGEKL